MEGLYALGGGWAYGCDPYSADFAGVGVELVKHFKEGVHAVRAGENQPVVSMHVLNEFGKATQIQRRLDAYGGQFIDVGTEFA